MKNPDKIELEVKNMSIDRHKWKMGIDFRDYNSKEFTKLMETRYAYLKESSKTLFKNVLEDSVVQEKLDYLLKMLRLVYNNEKTPDEADKEVGGKFSKEFINPLIEKANKDNN